MPKVNPKPVLVGRKLLETGIDLSYQQVIRIHTYNFLFSLYLNSDQDPVPAYTHHHSRNPLHPPRVDRPGERSQTTRSSDYISKELREIDIDAERI